MKYSHLKLENGFEILRTYTSQLIFKPFLSLPEFDETSLIFCNFHYFGSDLFILYSFKERKLNIAKPEEIRDFPKELKEYKNQKNYLALRFEISKEFAFQLELSSRIL